MNVLLLSCSTGEVTPKALTFSPARYMSPKRLGVFVEIWFSKPSMLMGPGSPNRWSISKKSV